MPYSIELMSLGDDIRPLLQRAADSLNGIQSEFRFHLTTEVEQLSALTFKRSNYNTNEIWNFLRDHKTRFGGNRPYIIAFVARPLESPRLRNIFGSHEAAEGFAVVTTYNVGQYVKEENRYCCYYLTRYCMSFINPTMRAHDDAIRKNCYFHRKMHKPEIRASMDAGFICDECRKRLDKPVDGGGAHRLSDAERNALQKMLQYVSGELPQAIVLKGGGVKGLAFAGALMELENFYWFDRHVGTSAGAIAAVLLAAGYTPAELSTILSTKNFRDFTDAPFWKIPLNLLRLGGFYPGENFRLWLADLLSQRIPKLSEVPMAALNGALVYASRPGSGTVIFDSAGERREAPAAFAARCSMSIPIFFAPTSVAGRRAFDGGMRNNFPLARFLNDHPRSNFIALYLGKPDNSNRRWIGTELLDIWIEGEERQTVDRHIQDVVVIDTSPIGTVDFGMTPTEKELLLKVGKAAALRFLLARNLEDGPSREAVEAAEKRKQAAILFIGCADANVGAGSASSPPQSR
jgi:predicted acylesterase/phospholipase RssA